MKKPKFSTKFYVGHALFLSLLVTSIFLAIVASNTIISVNENLSTEESIMYNSNSGIILVDRNNKPFFTFYQAHPKKFTPLQKIPKNLQLATIAAEDKDFYQHSGLSVTGIIRSLVQDFKDQSFTSGGSTITQQLVKNTLLNPQKDVLRKFKEIVIATDLENKYSKGQILEMYLNSVYFGEGSFGIEAASEHYFNKSADQLTLAESALLIGILPSPSHFSPFTGNFAQAKERQHYVLDQMVKQGYISKNEKIKAESEPLKFQKNIDDLNKYAPHFALMVRDELIDKYGQEAVEKSGFVVKTSLNLDWQKYAEGVVTEQVKNLNNHHVSNAAVVVIDPHTGEVLALVGSSDWSNDKFGKVNMATALRQPGSSFKPITYSTAFEQGIITPATILHDQPTTFPPNYRPLDYDLRFRGPVTVRRALSNSLNIPAVEVLTKVGIDPTLHMARRLGITTLNNSYYGLALTLGAGEVKLIELTSVYAVFASNGNKAETTLILEVKDKQNNVIYHHTPQSEPVLDPKYTFLISSILSDSKTRREAFGTNLDTSVTAAVKTGTSTYYKDSWTMGYTPNLAVGVWVGNNNGDPMDGIAGSLGAAPIWKSLITKFSENSPTKTFDTPSGIIKANACYQVYNEKKEATVSAYSEYFVKGTEPIKSCFLNNFALATISNPPPAQLDKNPNKRRI